MRELGRKVTDAALAELASEDQSAFDRAVDLTAPQARGRSVDGVEEILRAEVLRRGLSTDGTRRVAEQIHAAVNEPR